MKNLSALFLGLITLSIYSCQTTPSHSEDPFIKIKDKNVKTLLLKAMDAAGGLTNWNNKKELHFKKYFALYDSIGQTESAVNQIHHYSYEPKEDILISWEKDGAQHQIHYADKKVEKLVNNEVDPNSSTTSLTNTVRSATFVMNIPFNLLDEGAILSYEGQAVLEGELQVEVLKAEYSPSQHSNHTTPDTWLLYFDQQDYKLISYVVQHADHYSMVKNLGFTKVGGFLFPIERKSWRVDSDHNLLYLRADYVYSDYEFL